MRDPKRDQESAERFVDQTDSELIAVAKRINRTLIDNALELSKLYERRLAKRTRDQAELLKAIRYELVRRRVPNSSGANVTVNATGTVSKQINADTTINVDDMSGGLVTGFEIGNVGGE